MIIFKDKELTGPYREFKTLYDKAVSLDEKNPQAACVSSYNKYLDEVDARFVNIKYLDRGFFYFFSNYDSKKSYDFNTFNKISLVFLWNEINVQVRIKGSIKKSSSEISDNHFTNRKREKNLVSIISNQSETVESFESFLKLYKDSLANVDTLNRPAYWGGYEVFPQSFEFWKGNKNRLNERKLFIKINDDWTVNYLQP